MFLQLSHTKLDIFQSSKEVVMECYKITKRFPYEERFSITQQIRRAALSVHLNIAEGCSKKSLSERKRFFEIARGSVIEVDSALDIALQLNYCHATQLEIVGKSLVKNYKLLSGLISAESK